MATFDITVNAQSNQGENDTGSNTFTEPGDFDGATIDDVSVVGTPTITTDGATDDTIGVRFNIETSTGTDIWGSVGTNAASACFAVLGDLATTDIIIDGSAPSPAPSTAVAADWDQVAFAINYTANMMADAETCSWSSFTIRVTYTVAADNHVALPGTGTLVLDGKIPTVDRTDNHVALPGTGTLALTGLTPTTKMGVTIPVGVGTLVLEGFPPPSVLQPSDFGLKLTGFSPSVEFSFTIPIPVGSLVLDGKIPTVDVSEGVDHTALPGTGTLALTGQAPTVIVNQVIAVPVGSLTLTGLAPEVIVPLTVSPALGTLVLAGQIPTLVQTENHIRAPPVGSLDLTGQVPAILTGDDVIAQPDAGSLVLTGLAPTVEISHVASPGVGSLTLTGQAPTTGGVAIEVPVGSLILEGFPPPSVLQPSDFGLRLTGFIPTVSAGVTATPGTGSLTITGEVPALEIVIVGAESSLFLEGFAPTVTVTPNKFLKIPVGSLNLNGFEPLPVVPQGSRGVQPGSGQLNLTGFAPTVYLSKYFPGTGTLNLQGFAPTVTVSAPAVAVRAKGGGFRKIRYVIEVDDQEIEVSTIAEAESILRQVRVLAKEAAEKDVRTTAPNVAVKTAAGNQTTSVTLQRAVKKTQQVVIQAYRSRAKEIAQDIEISKLMLTKIQQEEADDESAIIALLLM